MLGSGAQIKAVKPMGTVFILLVLLVTFVSFNVNYAFAAEWDKPGYELTFQEEFNGNSVDSSKWNDWDLNFGNRGPGIVGPSNDYAFCPENVSVSNGVLRLTTTRNTITAPLCGGGTKTVNYRTGEVNTLRKFQQKYGWFEARIKFPKARALYPAFWLMPAPGVGMIEENGGNGAEVDIMEYETYWMGNQVTSSIWYGGYGANLQGGGIGTTYSPISDSNDWHVYALNWEPGLLEIYVDGKKTQTYTGEGVPRGEEYIILSLHVASWGKSCVDSELPDSMLVDYVRAYKKSSGSSSDPINSNPVNSNPGGWTKNPIQSIVDISAINFSVKLSPIFNTIMDSAVTSLLKSSPGISNTKPVLLQSLTKKTAKTANIPLLNLDPLNFSVKSASPQTTIKQSSIIAPVLSTLNLTKKTTNYKLVK